MWTLCILQSSYYEGELLIAAPWETGMELQGENVETDSGKTPILYHPGHPLLPSSGRLYRSVLTTSEPDSPSWDPA